MNVDREYREHDQPDPDENKDGTLTLKKGFAKIDGDNRVRDFSDAQRQQIEQESIAEDAKQVTRNF